MSAFAWMWHLTSPRLKKSTRSVTQVSMLSPSNRTKGWYWLMPENFLYSASCFNFCSFSKYFPFAGILTNGSAEAEYYWPITAERWDATEIHLLPSSRVRLCWNSHRNHVRVCGRSFQCRTLQLYPPQHHSVHVLYDPSFCTFPVTLVPPGPVGEGFRVPLCV